jgi:hypothetical protein
VCFIVDNKEGYTMKSITRIKRHVMTYEECARVGRKHHRDTNFCMVIATAVATEIAFSRARAILAKHAFRQHRRGLSVSAMHCLLDAMGYEVKRVLVRSKTLKTVQRELAGTSGAFFVYTNNHVSCVKDGVMQDWARSDIRPSNKRIEQVYQITPTDKVVRY